VLTIAFARSTRAESDKIEQRSKRCERSLYEKRRDGRKRGGQSRPRILDRSGEREREREREKATELRN